MTAAAAIVAESRRWLDVPFQHQGRSRYGVDCIGLVLCVLETLHLLPVDLPPANYRRQVKDPQLLDEITGRCERRDRAEAGGIILIRWPAMKVPTHVAICTGENMIHAYARARAVREVGYRAQWARWTHSFYRLPGVLYT